VTSFVSTVGEAKHMASLISLPTSRNNLMVLKRAIKNMNQIYNVLVMIHACTKRLGD